MFSFYFCSSDFYLIRDTSVKILIIIKLHGYICGQKYISMGECTKNWNNDSND